jgi:glycosyltransferase involved in cell wall biosynthesis
MLKTSITSKKFNIAPTKMKKTPKMLEVETGWVEMPSKYFSTDEVIDYRVYDKIPKWWRFIEKSLRIDLYLAFKVQSMADQYDIIWANSEKVGIPLSFLNIKKPLVVILQHPESPLKVILMKLSGIAKRWAGVGIVAKEARNFLQTELGVSPERIFQYYAARTHIFKPAEDGRYKAKGSILSMGVTKRDYDTMIEALSDLPGYQTEIFISSKYGDKYQGRKIKRIADWIQFPQRISDEEVLSRYQKARFVVVPLMPTSHSGAGVTSVFEASASGKAVIATQTGRMDSYVIHGKTGILVPPRNVHAMRNAIKMLWENEDLAREMGIAGRKFVEENYQYESVEAGITTFLTKLWNNSQKMNS